MKKNFCIIKIVDNFNGSILRFLFVKETLIILIKKFVFLPIIKKKTPNFFNFHLIIITKSINCSLITI